MLHTMNRLASMLCVLLCVGCTDEIPPLAPYVDFNPPPGGEPDFGEPPTADTGGRIDRDDDFDLGFDGSSPLDMALADDMSDPDITSMFDWAIFDDMALTDGEPFDDGIDGMAPDGDPADLGLDDMMPSDLDPLDQSPPEPDMRPPMVREVCNGIDDDADGLTDEEPNCGQVIVDRCKVFLGFHDFFGSPGTFDSWGACPERTTDGFNLDSVGCVGTENDASFRRISTAGGDVNDFDEIAFAFICDDDAIGRWYQSRCTVLFGQADRGFGDAPGSRDEWAALDGQDPEDYALLSTSGDGRFHAMGLLGDVNDDDAFAIAFRCRDDTQPARAAAAQASVNVVLAWADGNTAPADRTESWMPGCPAEDGTALAADVGIGCAGSNFDGRFYRINLSGDVNGDDDLGIALLPRRPPRDEPR